MVLLQIKSSGSGDENGGLYFRVRYYCENGHTFYLEKLISSHCFLNKYSKDFFDNGVGIHRRKEDLKKSCNVPFELYQ